MNYNKIYDNLILSRQKFSRSKNTGFFENHHIIPKSLGGLDDKINKVLLTPKEHFIAHLLLTKMYIGKEKAKMCYALFRMCRKSKSHKRLISASQFELAKKLMRKNCSGVNAPFYGKHHSIKTKLKISIGNKGKILSKETRKKLSIANMGINGPFYGKHHSTETSKKISNFNKGRHLSEETKKKISEATKGRYVSKETKLKMSNSAKGKRLGKIPWNKGKKMNDEFKKKISLSRNWNPRSEAEKQKISIGIKNSNKKKKYTESQRTPLPYKLEEFKHIILSSGIDLTMHGWSSKLAKIFKVKSIMVRLWMKRYTPEIYKTCYKRKSPNTNL